MPTLALPSGATDADRFARSLATLIGPSITAADGTLVAEDLRELGATLADVRATVARAIDQAHASTTTDLLPEVEGELGLPYAEGLPTATRQARVLAKRRSRGDATRLGIERAVKTLAPDAEVTTNGAALVEGTDPLAAFRLRVTLGDDWDDGALVPLLDALLATQASGPVTWTIGRSAGFRCAFRNSALDSRCDVDLLSF